jgi:hypothetical protein
MISRILLGLRQRILTSMLLIGAVFVTSGPNCVAAQDCAYATVGIDTSAGNCHTTVELGYGLGETFLAPDTLISAITVWRWYYDANNDSIWHLYVLGLDSGGRPDVTKLIHDGPNLQNAFGNGIDDIPFRFLFDPPLSLPSPGTYAFVVQAENCGAVAEILENCTDDYPDGELWVHDRVTQPPCHLRPYPTGYPGADLVFSVDFCHLAVPTVPSTLARVKAMYR